MVLCPSCLILEFWIFFSSFSFSNILVFPALPIIMILGLIFPLLSLVSSFLGWLAAMFCSLFLSYLILVIDFFAFLPFAKAETSLFLFFLLYLPLLVFLFFQKKKESWNFFKNRI